MASFKQELIKKLSIALLIIIIPIGILAFLGWDIDGRAETVMVQRQKLADRSEELSLFAKLQSQSNEADSYLGVLKNALPDRDQLLDFQKEMERLATQEGMGFGFSFKNETPSTTSEAGRMGFNIITEGSLYKVLNFIKSAEAGRFLVDFKSFNFVGSTVNITGEVLFY